MKVAFLTPEYPHELTGPSGGIGTSIKNLTQGLLKNGHEVRVLVYGQNADEIFEDGGVVIQKIKNVKFKGLSLFFTQKKIENLINLLYGENLIDLVEAPDWTGITSFIKPAKCPIVIRLHGSDTYFCYLDKRPVKWINRFHEKRALKNADSHLSVSKFTAEMTNTLFGLNINFEVIPNGVVMNSFTAMNSQENEQKIILYFGTLIRKKGILDFPVIFTKLVEKDQKIHLHLVGKDSGDVATGNPSTWELMKPLFSELAFRNVHYIGKVPYNEMQEQIAKANVCVFPTFAEALPVSWLEAMAMEKAIVASDIGWAPEVIQDGVNGYLVHPQEHEKFAMRIFELLENEQKRTQIGNSARQRVNDFFESSLIAQRNETFYKRMISK